MLARTLAYETFSATRTARASAVEMTSACKPDFSKIQGKSSSRISRLNHCEALVSIVPSAWKLGRQPPISSLTLQCRPAEHWWTRVAPAHRSCACILRSAWPDGSGRMRHRQEPSSLCSDRNLYSGARKGLSYSSAPATYSTRPKPSSKFAMLTVLLPATSLVHRTNHSARRSVSPTLKHLCNSSNPTHATTSPPAVFFHERGTPDTAQSTKKTIRADRYSAPAASRWNSSTTSIFQVRAECPTQY